MASATNSVTPTDFVKRLREDKVEAGPRALVGMVKKSDGDEEAFDFAIGGNCSAWVMVPAEFVEDVEILRTVKCKNHSHPLVRMNLKSPQTAEGRMLWSLLQASRLTAPQGATPNPTTWIASQLGGGVMEWAGVMEPPGGCYIRCGCWQECPE